MLSDVEIFHGLGRNDVERVFEDAVGAAWSGLWGEGLARLRRHGDFERFLGAALDVPATGGSIELGLDAPAVRFETDDELDATERALLALAPWRKGPFSFRSPKRELFLDAEWRSNLKWDRLVSLASPFSGRTVLDVGSGNGYYLHRLAGCGAELALGVEPGVLMASQFLALSRAFRAPGVALLPVPIEMLSRSRATPHFDTVLSMGVLYHRRDARAHLRELRELVRPGGEIVVETLVVDGPRGHVLEPGERYAQMRNVFSIPSVLTLERWLEELGLRDLRFGPLVPTTSAEQRSTRFMPHPSLDDFLEPPAGNDDPETRRASPRRTIEGHPGPKRVLVVGQVE